MHSHNCKCRICSPATWQNLNCNSLQFISGDNSVTVTKTENCTYDIRAIGAGGGGVSSVGISMPTGFIVSGSPVTTIGTLAVSTNLNGPIKGNGTGFVAGEINLISEVTGILPTNSGGTGLNSLGTALQVLRVNAGGTALEYTTPTNQNITLSGDVTGVGATAITTTIANSAVTFAKMQNISTSVLLGRTTAGPGVVEQITVGSGLQLTGGVLSSTAGSVSNVSVASANGFAATITNPTTTPNITLRTTLSSSSIPFIGGSGALSENNAALNWNNGATTLTVNNTLRTDVINALPAGNLFLTLRTDASTANSEVLINDDGLGVGTFAGGTHTSRLRAAGKIECDDAFILDDTVSVIGEFFIDGGSAIGLRSISNHPLTFSTNSVEQMRLAANGNLTLSAYPNSRNDGTPTNVLYAIDGTGAIGVGPVPYMPYFGFDNTNKSLFYSDDGSLTSSVVGFSMKFTSAFPNHRFGLDLTHVGVDNNFRGITCLNLNIGGTAAAGEIFSGMSSGGSVVSGGTGNSHATNPALGYFVGASGTNGLWIGSVGGPIRMGLGNPVTNTLSEHVRITNLGGGILGMGIGTTIATAKLVLGGSTTAASTAPLKFLSGTNLTTAETGAVEYNGTNLFFTRTGTTRESVFTGTSGAAAPNINAGATVTSRYGGDTTFLGNPDSWASVVIGGTTYKIPLYT